MTLDRKIRNLNHKRIDFFRAVKLKLTYYFCIAISNFVSKPKVTHSKTFLVLRLDDKLGDSVASTGFLRALKKSSQNAKVIVVAGPSTILMYKGLGFVDDVIESKKGFLNSIKTLFLLKKLSTPNFIINTSHILNPRSVLFVSLLPAAEKIGFTNESINIFTKSVTIDFVKDHITDRYRKLLTACGLTNANEIDISYELTLNEASVQKVSIEFSKFKRTGKPILAINCFAGGKLRNLNELTVKALIIKIADYFDAIIFLANAGDHRILQAWKINELNGCILWPELSSLNDNVAIANAADMVLTPDTSWVHLACALKKNLVAIYREDLNTVEANSVIWAPFGTKFKRVFARFKDPAIEDINDININEVADAVKELLQK